MHQQTLALLHSAAPLSCHYDRQGATQVCLPFSSSSSSSTAVTAAWGPPSQPSCSPSGLPRCPPNSLAHQPTHPPSAQLTTCSCICIPSHPGMRPPALRVQLISLKLAPTTLRYSLSAKHPHVFPPAPAPAPRPPTLWVQLVSHVLAQQPRVATVLDPRRAVPQPHPRHRFL